MAEAMRLLLQHSFGTLDTHRIEAEIEPGNIRSARLADRLGFSPRGIVAGSVVRGRAVPIGVDARAVARGMKAQRRRLRNILMAAVAAPKPLSMFTATTPGAQEASATSSATRPPVATP